MSELEKIFLNQVDKETPDDIKSLVVVNLDNKTNCGIELTIDRLKDHLTGGTGLGISKWLSNYEKESKASTGGIRGVQNPLYPQDVRYPLNMLGVALATLGKSLVINENKQTPKKLAACEVRYNSRRYVELIARIQASQGIKTLVTENFETIPIWLVSFLIFMLDLDGGEYVTSSHAISKKIATKDLNNQGSQYSPEEYSRFITKIKGVVDQVEREGKYTIRLSEIPNSYIDDRTLKNLDNGVPLYADYLRRGVANDLNLQTVKNLKNKLVVECMGGCMYKTLTALFAELKISDRFIFLRKEEDPFFHGVGKYLEKDKIFDWGCDSTIVNVNYNDWKISTPVLNTMDYETLLKDYPIGTTVLITDPDGDRLVTACIESAECLPKIDALGLINLKISDDKLLVMFTPNQSFLMTFDFQAKSLKDSGLWNKYDWFLLKTTASQTSWDEWGEENKITVVNTPVGFKELADIIQKIEHRLENFPNEDVFITDIFSKRINLGKNPRLLFAGEESGGEILGIADFITSSSGRKALSMREKSAGEAMIVTAAMAGWLEKNGKTLVNHLSDILAKNNIKSRFEIRIDHKYYNENEPNIELLLKEKEVGIGIRTDNDRFFLSIALAKEAGMLSMDQIKKLLSEAFTDLDFKDLTDIQFVGDGTFLRFQNKCVEVRPSGTDAINKAYAYGNDRKECVLYAQRFVSYSGTRTKLHRDLIPSDFYDSVKETAYNKYIQYRNKTS